MLAAVSHDLRTPLTAIKGIANEIWRGGDPQQGTDDRGGSRSAESLVGDLLELSQLNAGICRLTSAMNAVDDVIGAALERVGAVHGHRRIDVDIADDGGIHRRSIRLLSHVCAR